MHRLSGIKFWKTSAAMTERPVLVLGSSAGEQFDYIFGDNPAYHPFWASGWSARGLLSEGKGSYLERIVAPVDRTANVFLVFGSVDIVFNAAFRANTHGFSDFRTMITEARRGIFNARRILRKNGFRQIHAVFAAPPPQLPDSYWARHRIQQQLPTLMLANMYTDLAADVARRMPTINLVSRLAQSEDFPALSMEFARQNADHHPDYLKVGPLVYDAVKDIPGILPRRVPEHTEHYRHKTHFIKKLKEECKTRPRTCC